MRVPGRGFPSERWSSATPLGRRIWDVLDAGDMEGASLFSAVGLAVAWGLWLLIFPTFQVSPAFEGMEQLASQTVWGLWFLAVGLTQGITTVISKRREGYALWQWSTFVAAISWGMIVSTIAHWSIAGTGFPIYTFFLFWNLNQFRRLCRARGT